MWDVHSLPQFTTGLLEGLGGSLVSNLQRGGLWGAADHIFYDVVIYTYIGHDPIYTTQKKKEKQTKTTRKPTTISTLLMSSHNMHNAVALLLWQLPLGIPICWIGFNMLREQMMKIHVSNIIKHIQISCLESKYCKHTRNKTWVTTARTTVHHESYPIKRKTSVIEMFWVSCCAAMMGWMVTIERYVVRISTQLLSSSQIITAFGIIQAVLSSPWQHPGFLME